MSIDDLWVQIERLGFRSPMEFIWFGIGMLGQLLFFGRFLIQWLASEKARKSVVPVAFWYFSLVGGAVLLVYACYQKDPVFILGQAGGLVIYLRNLVLIYRHEAAQAADPPATA